MLEAKPTVKPTAEQPAVNSSRVGTSGRLRESKFPGYDQFLASDTSVTSTSAKDHFSSDPKVELKPSADPRAEPTSLSKPDSLDATDHASTSRDTSIPTPPPSSPTATTTRSNSLSKRRRMNDNSTARGFRPVYRRTSTTITNNDLTVHRVPAIPELNYRGNLDSVYQGVEATMATGFITLRLNKQDYRELFNRTDSMTRTGTVDPQCNRPFVTLKYGKRTMAAGGVV